MKPFRRRIRRHFGLTITARQMAVRSKRPWYFQWMMAVLFVASGYLIAYWQFTRGENIFVQLRQIKLENQSLHTKVIQVEQQLQIEKALQNNLTKELNLVQDENIKVKQDLIFYKNMVGGKK